MITVGSFTKKLSKGILWESFTKELELEPVHASELEPELEPKLEPELEPKLEPKLPQNSL